MGRKYDASSQFFLTLTPEDTTLIKALAMLAIVAHNFLHQVRPVPLENEFTYSNAEGIWTAIAICIQSPAEIIHVLLSFFGHYGVVAFVFLSGYGLTKKLLGLLAVEGKDFATLTGKALLKDAFRLTLHQILKTLKLIALGVPIALAWQIEWMGCEPQAVFYELFRFLTFTNNFWPEKGVIWDFVSVWWFFALIIQLYLLFPLFVWGLNRHPAKTLYVVLFLLGAAGVFYREAAIHYDVLLFATPLAQSAVFVLGMYLALGFSVNVRLMPYFGFIFLLSQFAEVYFSVSFMALALWTAWIYQSDALEGLKDRLKKSWFVMSFGLLSGYIFLIHGFMRHPYVEQIDQMQETAFKMSGGYAWWDSLIVLGSWFIWTCFVFCVARLIHQFERVFCPRLPKI